MKSRVTDVQVECEVSIDFLIFKSLSLWLDFDSSPGHAAQVLCYFMLRLRSWTNQLLFAPDLTELFLLPDLFKLLHNIITNSLNFLWVSLKLSHFSHPQSKCPLFVPGYSGSVSPHYRNHWGRSCRGGTRCHRRSGRRHEARHLSRETWLGWWWWWAKC